MPGIAVMVSSMPESGATSVSEKVRTICVGRATEALAAGLAGEDLLVEDFLGQFFVVLATQFRLQVIDGVVGQAVEVVLTPARLQQHGAQQGVERFEVVDVDLGAEGDHLLVHLALDGRSHGKQSI